MRRLGEDILREPRIMLVCRACCKYLCPFLGAFEWSLSILCRRLLSYGQADGRKAKNRHGGEHGRRVCAEGGQERKTIQGAARLGSQAHSVRFWRSWRLLDSSWYPCDISMLVDQSLCSSKHHVAKTPRLGSQRHTRLTSLETSIDRVNL